jgi:hypothetical protein
MEEPEELFARQPTLKKELKDLTTDRMQARWQTGIDKGWQHHAGSPAGDYSGNAA